MSTMRQPSVAHTGITVRDLDESLRFWTEALRTRILRRFHLGGEFAAQVVGVPGAQIDAAVLDLHGHAIELLQLKDIGAWQRAQCGETLGVRPHSPRFPVNAGRRDVGNNHPHIL